MHSSQASEIATRDPRSGVALQGKVKELTGGSGYRVEAEQVPERLEQELRSQATAVAQRNGNVEFLFSSRDEAMFLQALAARGLVSQSLGSVPGTDYSNGQRMVLTLYAVVPG